MGWCFHLNVSLPSGSDDKGSACSEGDVYPIPKLGRSPGEGNDNELLFLPGILHGQKSLVGYSLWGSERVRHNWMINFFLIKIMDSYQWIRYSEVSNKIEIFNVKKELYLQILYF